jgi:DNA topoisomerase-1
LSDGYSAQLKNFISQTYGPEYLNPSVTASKNKPQVSAQDAHEAIRPIDVNLTPEIAKNTLSKDEYALYKLI